MVYLVNVDFLMFFTSKIVLLMNPFLLRAYFNFNPDMFL